MTSINKRLGVLISFDSKQQAYKFSLAIGREKKKM